MIVRQKPYDLIYMWNLYVESKKNYFELIDTEDSLVVARGGGRGRGM